MGRLRMCTGTNCLSYREISLMLTCITLANDLTEQKREFEDALSGIFMATGPMMLCAVYEISLREAPR